MIEVGQTVPNLDLVLDTGSNLGEASSLPHPDGKWVVLYFYPKDDTPGCTKESIGFSEVLNQFTALDSVIIGVSKDSLKKHEKFRTKHDLTVELASDENSQICETFGTWVEKSMYGKTYMGIERATFIIDDKGLVRQAWRKVKVPGHVEAVLEELKALKA